MQIAILGYRRNQRNEVEKHIRRCLGNGSPYTIRQYSLDEPVHNPVPPDAAAVFAIVEDARALETVKRLVNWGRELPLVIIRAAPDYTVTGRIKVIHYLTFPLTEQDVRVAMGHAGLEMADGGAGTGTCAWPETKRTKEMQIAILGDRLLRRNELESLIRSCLGEHSEIDVNQYGMSEPGYNPAPPGIAAAFVIVEDALALDTVREVTNWGRELPELPVVIASNDPGYALAGIRCQVTYYILFPLVEKDVREALHRVGLGGDAR